MTWGQPITSKYYKYLKQIELKRTKYVYVCVGDVSEAKNEDVKSKRDENVEWESDGRIIINISEIISSATKWIDESMSLGRNWKGNHASMIHYITLHYNTMQPHTQTQIQKQKPQKASI